MKRGVFLIVSLVACSPRVEGMKPSSKISADVIPAVPLLDVACPSDMVKVEGDYCTDVKEECLVWVDVHGNATKKAIPADHDAGRCGVFKQPTTCVGKKVHQNFCIDLYEYPNIPGQKPQSWMTWYDVKSACKEEGKRLCEKREWTFACEGPEMHPLPYGDGYHRDSTMCNIDNQVPSSIKDLLKVSSRNSEDGKTLDGLLTPSGAKTQCKSPFGVFDMVGNIDEFVVNETKKPYVSGLMSGHVFGVRNACRPMTEAHGPGFSWYETGGRCCISL